MALLLHGRVALITGSRRGIGLAAAKRMAALGAAIALHSEAEGETEAAALRAQGATAEFHPADLANPAAPAQLCAALQAGIGAPDILVLNASIEILQDWRALTEDAMAAQAQINLFATMRLLQAFLPGMLERGWGRVIAIGSVQEHRPNASHIFYAGLKAAQTNIILNLARTTRQPGITFNVVRPGAILTDRNRAVLANPAALQSVLDRIPIGRLGNAEDCAGLIAFLATPDAAYINGATLAADGGLAL